MTDWQTAKARAIGALQDAALGSRGWDAGLEAALNALRASGYPVVRASDPPAHVRSLGFQAHANGGAKAFGATYEAMVREMAKETAE